MKYLNVKKIVTLLRNMDLKDRLSDDLRSCGDFLGIDVGKKLGICTRKNTNSDETNDDGDYSDRRQGGVKSRRLKQCKASAANPIRAQKV